MLRVEAALREASQCACETAHFNAMRQMPWRLKYAGGIIVEDEVDSIIVNST